MQDVMIDIETLDTRPSAAILSIGLVRFDVNQSGTLGDSFEAYIDIDSNLSAGRTVSGPTLLWWLDQEDAARRRIVEAEHVPLRTALARLSDFLKPDDRVWGNGAGFDNVILADAYRSVGLPQPWRYWNDMCYRTLKNLYKSVVKPKTTGVAHVALDDAMTQALHLQGIYAQLK